MRLDPLFPARLRGAPARFLFVSMGRLLCAGMLAGVPFTPIFAEHNTIQAASKAPTKVTTKPEAPEAKPASADSLRSQATANRLSFAGWRDPFRSNPPRPLHNPSLSGKAERLPGIAGLIIGELQLRGLVEEKASHRMVAVVTSGGTLAYFLHESDQLYDGTVTRITPAAVYLSRKAMPSGANPTTDSVVLRLQPEPGDKP
ncbi:MAG TPA: hypothetical protein VG206_10325 [Terriglobia bacterium]|nr:hypothetical protein [Terriglobia bacterium]